MQELSEGFRHQFSDNISRLLQQEGSILRKLVRNEQMEHEVEYFETILPSEAFLRDKHADNGYDIMNEIGSGAGAYAFRSPELKRRQLTAQQIFWHTSFDSGDKLNVLLEPKSFQIKDAAWALGRQYDRTIIKAMTAKAKTGKSGNIDVHFPLASHVIPVGVTLTVASNVPVAANIADPVLGTTVAQGVNIDEKAKYGKLTVAKLMKAREILKQDSFDSHQKMYFVCSHSQVSDLLHDPKITNIDYNSIRALVAGEVKSFLGFEFINSELLTGIRPTADLSNAYSVRDCLAFTEDAIIFGKVKNAFSANADCLPQHLDAILVKAMDSVGAMRMNDKGVVVVKCLEKYRASHANFASGAADVYGRKPNYVSTIPASLFPNGENAIGSNAGAFATQLGLADVMEVNAIMDNVAEKYVAKLITVPVPAPAP